MADKNPFAALIKDSNSNLKLENPNLTSENDLHVLLEKIFAITLNEDTARRREYMYMGDDKNCSQSKVLDLNILSYCLFERLFNCNKDSPVLTRLRNEGFTNSHCLEDRVVTYLYTCYNLFKENYSSLKIDDVNKIKAEIIHHLATAFTHPDIYYEQCLEVQLLDIMKETLPYYEEFFVDLCNEVLKQEEDGDADFKSVLTKLISSLTLEVIRTPLSTFEFKVFQVLKVFTLNETISNNFMDCMIPTKPQVGASYATCLIGALFNITILPKVPSASFEHFQGPLSEASIQSTEGMLWSKFDKIAENLHTFILTLLKSGPTVKEKVLSWFGQCLKYNSDRGKLWNSQAPPELNPANYTSVPDGFMIQLGNVMVRLCEPFSKDMRILKVDPTYCAVPNEIITSRGIHLPDMSLETCFVPTENEVDSTEERLTAENYSFITECFYLTHRSLHLGFSIAVDKIVKMNHEMGRIERAYNEALQQAAGNSDFIETIKSRMSSEMAKFISYKTQLSEPNMIKSMFGFVSSTAYWLSQVAVHQVFPDKQSYAPLIKIKVTFPLSDTFPGTLKCIPEFLIVNVVGFLVYLMRFSPKEFEEQGYEKMKPLMTFILMYMGNQGLVRNPHLRAQLAEGLEALLPVHKDQAAHIKNQLSHYQRTRLFTEHKHKYQVVKSLLEVFVGIEMTGQSVEFEQKFNYRRPMYAVMEYLWERREYHKFFESLAQDAEKNMEAVPPPIFLRFINLLMNDAVFLLDESLANMAKLKELLAARDNGEWDNLSSGERSQNMNYMHHIGMIARFDNILGRDTIKALERLTSSISIVFTHSTMVDRMAAMLNYFLLNLVGPNKKNFKVKDQKEYSFDPANTVLVICKIYINLKESDSFCLAVSQDGRSYSPHLFVLAEDVLIRIGGASMIEEMKDVATKVAKKAEEYQASEEVIAEAPEHFLDPIMSSLMTDPVILPSSKQIVDRTTIARHLLSDQTDPFNRAPLTMDQVIPNSELAEEIKLWIAERKLNK